MAEPQSPDPRPMAAPERARLPAWVGRVAPVLGGLAILLLGIGLGAAWERLIMHELLPVVSNVAVPFLAGVGAVLVPLTIGIFVLKHVWSRRVAGQELGEAKELVGQELERALSVWVYRKREPAWEEGRAERLKRLRELAMAAAKVGVAALGLRSSTALLAVVLGGTVAFASLLVSYLQIERLDRQNRLIELQNQLTVQEQESQALRARADAAYEQLAGILLDLESTEQAQIFALHRIPEAMRLAVPRARRSEEGRAEVVVDFPNLERLRGVLTAFMRQDRAFHALRRAGVVKPGQAARSVAWEDLERELVAQGEVSDALIEVLHRLGPEDPAHPKVSLWSVVPDSTMSTLPKPRLRPVESSSERVTWYDVTHLEPDDLRGVQLPFLFAGTASRESAQRVRFPVKVILTGARLDGANLDEVDLTGASLRGASLRRVGMARSSLVGAMLQGADLRGARLDGARLHAAHAGDAWFQGASLERAQLWGAVLFDTRMEGADLDEAELSEAHLRAVGMSGASLRKAQLIGARLSFSLLTSVQAEEADFTQAHFEGTSLRGANLRGAKLHGALLEGGDLRGTQLSLAQFQAREVRLKVHTLADGRRVRLRTDEASDGEPVAVEAAQVRALDVNRVGRAEVWRVPAFEKSAIRWLTGNWHLDAAEVEALAWEEGEPKALPADFEREVATVLRRQQTAATEARGASFEGVELSPALSTALGVRASPR